MKTEHLTDWKTIKFYKLQGFFHLFLFSLAWYNTPSDNWTQYLDNTIARKPSSVGIHVTYFFTLGYNLFLYFQDPVGRTDFHPGHLGALVSTLILLYYQSPLPLFYVVLMMLYDTWQFYRYDIKKVEKSKQAMIASMKIHHKITNLVILISWVHGFTWFGMNILYLHDLTDAIMFFLRAGRRQDLSMLKFQVPMGVVLMIVWFYHRIYWMGLITWNGILAVIKYGKTMEFGVILTGLGAASVMGLVVIWVLNVYWLGLLIYKMVRSVCLNENSDEDGE